MTANTSANLTRHCWVVTDGSAGNENPALGLAQAVGLETQIKRLRPRPPWTWLPGNLWPLPWAALGADSDSLAPPWPDLVISCGRRSVPYSLAIRRAGAACNVHIQNPRIGLKHFDLVAAPRHDGLSGANVISTNGSLHRLTAPLLALLMNMEAEGFLALLAAMALGTPTLSLIGGIGAALTVNIRRGGVLLSLLVLPLYIPVLIFGVSTVEAAIIGLAVKPYILIMAAGFAGSLALAPWATAAALRLALE